MGECFFWYRPARVVLDKRPLGGCVCVSMDKSKWHVTTDGNICCHGLWIYTILHTEEPKNCQLRHKSLGSSDERTLINLGFNAGFGYHKNTIFVV